MDIASNKHEPLALIENTYATRILVALLEAGPTPRTTLYRLFTSNVRTPMDRVKELVDAGLLREVPRNPESRVMLIDLTDKGRRIARPLAEIERELAK